MATKSMHLIQPYRVGKDKKSMAMILPSSVIRYTKFDPNTMFFLLKVTGTNSLHLQIINEKNIINENMESAQEFTRLPEQTPSIT
jgi:hypothetical protein